MADNVSLPASNVSAASRSVTYSGDSVQLPVVALATVSGSDDAKTVADVSSSNGLPTSLTTLISGENQTFNRLMGGPVVKYAQVTADTLVVSGSAIFYGVYCVTDVATADITVYDNTAESGTTLLVLDDAVNYLATFVGFGGVGVLCSNGIYVGYASGATGTLNVLYVDAA